MTNKPAIPYNDISKASAICNFNFYIIESYKSDIFKASLLISIKD